jgi:thioredoxin-like negative regulator of GroEL
VSARSAAAVAEQPQARPLLLFFRDPSSGPSRRVEGFLAQVLQRRRNHDTFDLRRIDVDAEAELARRCGVERSPALVVVENKRVRARLEEPRGCVEIQHALAPWLR